MTNGSPVLEASQNLRPSVQSETASEGMSKASSNHVSHTSQAKISVVDLPEDSRIASLEGTVEPEVEEEREPEEPYQPPPLNFIRLEFDDSPPILLNPNCRKKTIVNYINDKLSTLVDAAVLDLCNTHGELVNLWDYDAASNVFSLFDPAEIYIPCKVRLDDTAETLKVVHVEPCLSNWREKYPHMEGKLARFVVNLPKVRVNEESVKSDDDSTLEHSMWGTVKKKLLHHQTRKARFSQCHISPIEQADSHTVTSRLSSKRGSHNVTYRRSSKRDSHTDTYRPSSKRDSHTVTSRPSSKRGSHNVTYRRSSKRDSHTVTSRLSSKRGSHNVTYRRSSKRDSHTVTYLPSNKRGSHTVTSRPSSKRGSHTVTSRLSGKTNKLNKQINEPDNVGKQKGESER
ncbi:filaggrin-2-like isoform x4 [Plakobranchus ocellatus]|uniref:Filaggrin-2-like isoform x4 n=1 Tax=Plakobranchus ocellatus TaxID=259542 RepID=A0AAV4DSA9_9GAST|nr:filaggrin-2-like isoform x4 [Plakobranchus ocellatus]